MDNVVATLENIAAGIASQLPLIAIAGVVVLGAIVVGRLARAAVQRGLRRRDPSLARVMGQVTQGVVLFVGILIALWVALPTVRFTDVFASLGVTGIILGFALRDIIENFVAGLLILWRQPFVIGDQIRSREHEGRVEDINLRSTVLRNYDGVRVLIPNGRVFTDAVENRTANAVIRTDVLLGIDQGASIGDARRIILDTLDRVDGVLADPPPTVLFTEIAHFTHNLRVLFWLRPPTRFSELETRSEVTERLNEALRRAGISFPYPTRTVRLQAVEPMPVRMER